MHAFSSKGEGEAPLGFAKGGLKFSRGGQNKIRNRAAAVTGPQRHLAALGLVTLHSIIARATPQANPLKLINLHITVQ